MTDFLFRGSLVDLDPALDELTRLESERQRRKLHGITRAPDGHEARRSPSSREGPEG